MFEPSNFEPAQTIDLEGKTLVGEKLKSDTRYINGVLRECTASKIEKLVIGKDVIILVGDDNGLYLGGCSKVRIEPGVTVSTPDGVEAAKSKAGIYFRGGGDFSIEGLKVQASCTGVVMMEVDGYAITYSDFRGCSEDGIRSFGSKNGLIQVCLFTDFRLVNEASHRDGIQIAPFYNAKEGPKRSENITVRYNCMHVGKGVEFSPIFNRPYLIKGTLFEDPDSPHCKNVVIEDNLCFTQGGHAISTHGDGVVSRNVAVGYAGNAWASKEFSDTHVIGKMALTVFTGTAEDNQAEHFYYRDADNVTYRKGWTPKGKGNLLVEPYTLEQIEEEVSAWMAKWRIEAPIEPELPAGVTPEMRDWFDQRYMRAG